MNLTISLLLAGLSAMAQTHGNYSAPACVAQYQDRVSICTTTERRIDVSGVPYTLLGVRVTQYAENTERIEVRLKYLDREGRRRVSVQNIDLVRTAWQERMYANEGSLPLAEAGFTFYGTALGISVQEVQEPREFEP